MKRSQAVALAALLLTIFSLTHAARAQTTASATATQQLELSAFGGGTGTYTGILGGRNLGITAGGDLAFLTYHRFRPALELRATYPIHNGQLDAQKNFLGGLKVERDLGRFHPYADFLVGRGQIDYQRGGLHVGIVRFISSTSTVFSPGVGVDYDLTPQWAIKGDFQYQRWDVPFAMENGAPAPPTILSTPGGVFQVPTTGTIHPRVITLGAVYRFDFNHHYHTPRRQR
ncbi:MAG: hypothetical protein NVSMB3_14970 [Acidobacteriaceae bacterium]